MIARCRRCGVRWRLTKRGVMWKHYIDGVACEGSGEKPRIGTVEETPDGSA